MKRAIFIIIAAWAAAGAGAAQFVVGVNSGNFAHPFSGC